MQHTLACERQRVWPCPAPHALLDRAALLGASAVCVDAALSGQAWLHDHRVKERALFPAAAFMELGVATAFALLSESTAPALLRALSISIPLLLQQPRLAVRCSVDLQAGSLAVTSASDGRREAVEHVTGSVGVALQSSLARHSAPVTGAAVLPRVSFHASVEHRGASVLDGWWSHPGLLDSAIHLGEGAVQLSRAQGTSSTRIPVAIASFLARRRYARSRYSAAAALSSFSGSESENHHALRSSEAGCDVAVCGLRVKAVRQQTAGAAKSAAGVPSCQGLLYELEWQAAPEGCRSVVRGRRR
jgi:hypothetical protein